MQPTNAAPCAEQPRQRLVLSLCRYRFRRIGIPCYIGGVAGAGVSAVGYGAATAVTIAGGVVGGVVGAGLGALLAGAMVRRYADEVSDQRAKGGLVLWVSLRDDDAERRALHILRNAGGRDVHVHEFERDWTLKDRPLSDVQLDPLLLI